MATTRFPQRRSPEVRYDSSLLLKLHDTSYSNFTFCTDYLQLTYPSFPNSCKQFFVAAHAHCAVSPLRRCPTFPDKTHHQGPRSFQSSQQELTLPLDPFIAFSFYLDHNGTHYLLCPPRSGTSKPTRSTTSMLSRNLPYAYNQLDLTLNWNEQLNSFN